MTFSAPSIIEKLLEIPPFPSNLSSLVDRTPGRGENFTQAWWASQRAKKEVGDAQAALRSEQEKIRGLLKEALRKIPNSKGEKVRQKEGIKIKIREGAFCWGSSEGWSVRIIMDKYTYFVSSISDVTDEMDAPTVIRRATSIESRQGCRRDWQWVTRVPNRTK